MGNMRDAGITMGKIAGLKWGFTQALITVTTSILTLLTLTLLTLLTHLLTLSAPHLYPAFYPLPHPHARILPNALSPRTASTDRFTLINPGFLSFCLFSGFDTMR